MLIAESLLFLQLPRTSVRGEISRNRSWTSVQYLPAKLSRPPLESAIHPPIHFHTLIQARCKDIGLKSGFYFDSISPG
jgi:hypothetical protein